MEFTFPSKEIPQNFITYNLFVHYSQLFLFNYLIVSNIKVSRKF